MSGTGAPPADVAVVVLAHGDPEQLGHLLAALDPLPVVVHVDAKTPADLVARMLERFRPGVVLAPRRRTDLASWSLVAAEVEAVGIALSDPGVEHVAVVSGADYPLVSVPALRAELAADPATRLQNVPLPWSGWDTPRRADGGLWRLDRRFVTLGDRVLYLGDQPLWWPGRRALPAGVVLRGGSAWKVYSRSDAEHVVDTLERRPELVRRWRTTLVPEETFVMSVLASRTDAAPLQPQGTAWFVRWPSGDHHPGWLTEDDVPDLLQERLRRQSAGEPPLLFARKLSSRLSGGFRRAVDELRAASPLVDEL